MSCGIALRRAAVHPADDGVDLRVAQRAIVLELLNADGLVEVPGRHLTRGDAVLDRSRPRPRLFVGDERHRRDRIRPVAGLAFFLEDSRDVLGEGRSRLGGLGGREHRDGQQRHLPTLPTESGHETLRAPSLSPLCVFSETPGPPVWSRTISLPGSCPVPVSNSVIVCHRLCAWIPRKIVSSGVSASLDGTTPRGVASDAFTSGYTGFAGAPDSVSRVSGQCVVWPPRRWRVLFLRSRL